MGANFGDDGGLNARYRTSGAGMRNPSGNVVAPRAEYESFKKDAARFRFLQDLPTVEAQAFFWNYGSRTERAKAIDKEMNNRLIDTVLSEGK